MINSASVGVCVTLIGNFSVIKSSIQSWKRSCWDRGYTRCKKGENKKGKRRLKAESLILATGGMTSAGGGVASLFLASKEAGRYHQ